MYFWMQKNVTSGRLVRENAVKQQTLIYIENVTWYNYTDAIKKTTRVPGMLRKIN